MAGIAGNITDADRLKRVLAVDRLVDDGLGDSQIANELGMGLIAVKNAKKYMVELKKADLTGKDIAEKRAETYLKLIKAENEAEALFNMYKSPIRCPECEGTGRIEIETKGDVEIPNKTLVCGNCKGLGYIHHPKDAERFHVRWVETIKDIANLYGLNSIKAESFIQINAQTNQYVAPSINLDPLLEKALANSIISDHETKTRKRMV
jgi:hypothetical protein